MSEQGGDEQGHDAHGGHEEPDRSQDEHDGHDRGHGEHDGEHGESGGDLERIGGKLVHKGPLVSIRTDRFRYPDGGTDLREVVVHPGAVAILAHDGRVVHLVRQPREPVEDPGLLELPAGTLDREDETPLECAQRELAEEIGKSAGDWRELRSFYTSPGYSSERVHLFLATELYDVPATPEDNERIEIVKLPLDELDSAIARCRDAKSLIGLMELKRLL